MDAKAKKVIIQIVMRVLAALLLWLTYAISGKLTATTEPWLPFTLGPWLCAFVFAVWNYAEFDLGLGQKKLLWFCVHLILAIPISYWLMRFVIVPNLHLPTILYWLWGIGLVMVIIGAINREEWDLEKGPGGEERKFKNILNRWTPDWVTNSIKGIVAGVLAVYFMGLMVKHQERRTAPSTDSQQVTRQTTHSQ